MDSYRTTKARYVEKVKEKQYLETTKRNEISEQIRYAKSLGDFSENAELDAAKEANRQNEYRIGELAWQIANIQFINARKYTIYNEEEDEEEVYTLIGDDSNVDNNEISDTTPLGKVLVASKVGDRKKVVVGDEFYFVKVLDIEEISED